MGLEPVPPPSREPEPPPTAEEIATHAGAIARWEAAAAELLEAVPNQAERAVRAIVEVGGADTARLRALIPAKLDDREVASWFLEAMAGTEAPPLEQRTAPRGFWATLRRGGRQPPERGWRFDLDVWRASDLDYRVVTIYLDGRVEYSGPPVAAEHEGITDKALGEMARVAGLIPLTFPRHPGHRPELSWFYRTGRSPDEYL